MAAGQFRSTCQVLAFILSTTLGTTMSHPWIADRMHKIDASGIRKVFDLAANMKNPINLSIGQPHFDTPDVIKEAAKRAIDSGRNAYSQTQGSCR